MRHFVSIFSVRRLPLPLILLVAAVSAPAALAQNTYTWQTTTGNWNDGANWLDQTSTAGVPLSATNTTLVFNASGTQSYTATNNVGAATFTLNRLTVNNTGTGTVTIAGAAATNTLTFAGTDPTLDITGTTLFTGLFANATTLRKVGTGTFIHDSNNAAFTGTLTIDAGTFVNRSTVVTAANFNPVSIVVNNGGTYQFGENTTGDPNLPNSTYITVNAGGTVNWQEGETFGGFHLNGGTINLQQGSTTNSGTTAQNWTSGTLTGGAFVIGGATAVNKTTSGTVTVSGSAAINTTTGGLNIQDGTIAMVNAANLGTANITLGAAATAGTFEYQGLTATRAGTFAVNAGGGTIAVTNAASTLTLSGAFSGAGNLTKSGAGTLHLTGGLGSTGTTTAAAGTLRVNPVAASGGFAVNDGATLAINSGAGTATFTTPTLALSGTNPTVRFELNTASLPTAPLVVVSNADGLTGTGTLSLVNQLGFTNGTYTLIGYNGTAISSGFTLQLPGRTAGSLDYATAGQINAVITGSDTVKWGGLVNGTWDVGTAANVGGTNNWRLVSNNNATNFIATDTVTFDDSASGNFAVTIGGTVLPASVTVNNSANDYSFTGAGGIGGTGGLTKSGTGRLTVATANTYSGGTTVNAGTVQVGNGGTTGDLGTGTVSLADSTTLSFDRTDASTVAGGIATTGSVTISQLGGGVVTVGGSVTGTGTLTKNGVGELVLGANNNGFTGTVIINGGRITLRDISGGDLSATSIVVNNGGVFQFGVNAGENPDLPGGTVITVNTGGTARFLIGEDYGGFNLIGGTYASSVNNNLGLTSTLESGSITNIGGVNGSLAGAGLVQKTTAGTVTITGVALNGTGGLHIDQGVLSTDAGIGGSGVIRIGNVAPATLEYRGATATVSRTVTLDEGGGTVGVTTAATTYTLTGVMSGIGGLTKAGAGTLTLSGVNTYTGGTTVSGGTLLVTGDSSAANGAVAVQSGGTLGGSGTVGGTTTVQDAGRIFGGNGTDTGTLTTGNVTVNANGILAANIAASGTNSTLAVGGNTLNLVNGSKVTLTGLGGFSNTAAGTYTLATLSGDTLQLNGATTTDGQEFGTFTVGGSSTGTVAIDTTTFGQTLNTGDKFTLQRTGNNLVLNFSPVPEPAAMLGVSAAVLAVGGLLRRRLARKSAVAA